MGSDAFSALPFIQVLVTVDPGTVSNENQNKKQNQPNTGFFYPGTVLQKANPGLSLRVLAGKSNFLILVLSRKGNQKQTPSTGWNPGRKKSDQPFIQVLVKVDPGTVSNENQNKKQNQPNTVFLPRNGVTKCKSRFEPSGARRKKQLPSTGSIQER